MLMDSIILEEFLEALDCVKPLRKDVLDVLFLYDNNHRLFIGTPPSLPEKLYNSIIETFDKAIKELKDE